MIRFTCLLLALCLAWSSHAQQREQRVALVIGNAAYQSSPLKNPVNDATDMAQALKDKGFAVTLRTNIGNRDMRQAIRAFSQTLKAGGVGLFYFAGHGVQSKGRNYLIPLNAEIKEEFELEDEAFDANRVLAGMEEAGNRVNIVILDACRDNPFGRAWRTSATGLAQLSAPIGSFVAFATAPGSVAADGSGRNGLFTSHLLTSLRNPDSDIDRVFTRVAAAVARESGNKQVPWKSSSLTGEFRFAIADQPVPLVAQSPAAPAAVTAEQEERVFWEDAKAAGNQEAYEAYLENYPKGRYASLARANLARLNAAKAAAQKLATEAAAERANKAEQERRAAEEAQKAAQRAASERAAAEAAVKEQQRLAMEAQAKEQARLALLAQEQARVAAEAAQKLAAARLAELPQPGQTIKDCADCPEMVVLPAGSFLMGSPPDPQPDPFSNEKPKPPIGQPSEKPQHRVQIQSFAIGKYEVTQEQWYAVMGANPSSNKGRTLPVEQVSWDDAQVFIQKLNQKTGQQYRLPSEAEWEYAARAGSQAEYSFGDDEKELGRYAWYGANSGRQTHPVGEKQANRFGLHDMHGNVWEWVQDCWHDNYSGAPTDGSAWTTVCSEPTYYRSARGGSWANSPASLRSASRVQFTAWPKHYIGGDGVGFRLARTLFTP